MHYRDFIAHNDLNETAKQNKRLSHQPSAEKRDKMVRRMDGVKLTAAVKIGAIALYAFVVVLAYIYGEMMP